MNHGLLWASVASLLGIGAMGVIAVSVEPPQVDIAHLGQRLGATVEVHGDVRRIDVHDSGFSRLRLAARDRSVEVLVEEAVNVSTGDHVSVTGTVESYAGRVQVRLDRASDLTILRHWREDHVPLHRVLEAPWDLVGTHLRTSGHVTHDGRTTWLASSESQTRILLAAPGPLDGPHLVDGLLEYQAEHARLRLVVESATPLAG